MMFARKAPYFRTVRPQVRDVRPHHAELTHPQAPRACRTTSAPLHAIAVCNGLEAAMGLLAEATTPKGRRWIPKGMQVAYLAKSTTDLLCVAETDPADWAEVGRRPGAGQGGAHRRHRGRQGVITIYVSEKPAR